MSSDGNQNDQPVLTVKDFEKFFNYTDIKHIEDVGWADWTREPKPKAKISYGKKGKRKSIEVKK